MSSNAQQSRPRLICLTPVKNEAWILARFLEATSLWADEIIVADQLSEDGSREIARQFPKVRLIENNCPTYDESERQALLIAAARENAKPGERTLLLGLDADEFFSAEALAPSFWNEIGSHPDGTILHFERPTLRPGFRQYWDEPMSPIGFLDDGSPHIGTQIHSMRVPRSESSEIVRLQAPVILHYHAVNWERMAMKMRWYQCHEFIQGMETCPITLYRKYHAAWVAPSALHDAPDSWFEEYEKRGVEIRETPKEEGAGYWAEQFANLLREHGTATFSKLGIWDRNWNSAAKDLKDPRSGRERASHWLLEKSQPWGGARRLWFERVARRLLK